MLFELVIVQNCTTFGNSIRLMYHIFVFHLPSDAAPQFLRKLNSFFVWPSRAKDPFLNSPEKLFGSEKPFVKLRPTTSVMLIFLYV